MKIKKYIMMIGVLGFLFTSCSKDDEDFTNNVSETESALDTKELEVENFVYRGMNDFYLYKADVPQLADLYFSSTSEKNDYLSSFSSPEALFKAVTSSQDRFSFITDDYLALEKKFQGVSGSATGMKYGLGRISGTDDVFGFLQYVVPGTSADQAGLTRGTVFTEIDGQQMTISNYSTLLAKESFTINTGKIEDGVIKMTDNTVSLNKTTHTVNPVHLVKTLDVEGRKVGYLMYNSFVSDFDDELNAAFAQFKSDGVTDLVLDLRYNGGGNVETAVDLASMITGQFNGEIFMTEQWNEKRQKLYEAENPERLINRFNSVIRTGETINSLNFSKVYVLTTKRSASASELVINGLEPYINVIQVGETTTGKFQASVTLYDSPDFSKNNLNRNHTYALQPLVLKVVNSAGKTDYVNGLQPDVEYSENVSNLGTLGDPAEPLLQAALNHITGNQQRMKTAAEKKAENKFQTIGESGMQDLNYQRMYIDRIPQM